MKYSVANYVDSTLKQNLLPEGAKFPSYGDRNFEDFANLFASDGYSASVTFDELSNCLECLLSYSDDNGWSAVMHDFSGKFQVSKMYLN